MRALVVYETLWGNTEKIARAIGSELALSMSVDVTDVDSAPDDVTDYDLVIVGGPTHAFSMTRSATRASAAKENGAPGVPRRGIREWLHGMHPIATPISASAFDTRVSAPRLPGSAARAAKQELRSLGFDIAVKQRSFWVHGYEGPLVDGELERASDWAREITVELQEVP